MIRALHEQPISAGSPSPARLVAMYLPQFHPIPENDAWWGPGFTEWRNVAQAQPLYEGHYQPHLPADLGFYDLRLASARQAQADLARQYGIHGFCYYHYWFHGRRLLHQPLDEVLATGSPDFPFCLCWANEPWTRAWDGRSQEVLMPQQYSEQDDLAHIRFLAPILCEQRYIRLQGKPVLLVYRARLLPDVQRTLETWRREAQRLGVGALHLVRVESFADERHDATALGFDAGMDFQPDWTALGPPLGRSTLASWGRRVGLTPAAFGEHRVYDYAGVVKRMLARPKPNYPRHPCVLPSWDNSPRRDTDAVIFHDCRPDLLEFWLEQVLAQRPSLVFINAWNEWGEGNHLEPDLRYGHARLEAVGRALQKHTISRERKLAVSMQ